MADGAENRIPNVLSIAGVDPSGGAGLLADVKAMSACGTYACGVVTALTAQNTKGVDGIFDVTPDFVREQLETLFADVRVDAVKIGMLNNAGVAVAVAESLERHRPGFVVRDGCQKHGPSARARGGRRVEDAPASPGEPDYAQRARVRGPSRHLRERSAR